MADPEPRADPYSPRPLAPSPGRKERDGSGAAIALGAVFLLPLLIWGVFEFQRSAPAAPAAGVERPPIFQPAPPPAAGPVAAPPDAPEGDRMMLAPGSDRIEFRQSAAGADSALQPQELPAASRRVVTQTRSIDLDINDPHGLVSAVAVEINDLQVNRYAVRALPTTKLSIPLPDLPVFVLVYKVIGRDGSLLSKETASFQRNGDVFVSNQSDPRRRGAYGISDTFVGPFQVHRPEPVLR